ncbi:DUF4129 domain-containing protein [Nocardioides sp. URHA0020]|uniref:DUF4129 domain-containing protein n=1 Tax=Nocardioides sp. URHA0020 TaxID=1380392 RepID=UPI00048E27DF|nr:DUF4129 domain-containing protein [Nocardioides sp. URHA0020]
MTARRAGTLAVALVAAGVLLSVLLVTWAASIGPSEVLHGAGPSPATPTAVPSSAAATPSSDDETAPDPDDGPNNAALLRVLALVLNLATLVVALVLLGRMLRWLVRARRVRRARQLREAALGGSGFAVIEPGAAVARELIADAEGQRDALAGDTPRNAVVACWQRFETAAGAAGIERREWETSSEHTIRVLDLAAADPAAVSRLARLYREARFSEHQLTEDDRAAALESLEAIHRTIGAPA